MLRVLIVDDSPTACGLLAGILGSDPDIQIVGETVNGAEAIQQTRDLRPALVTMDVHMPHMDGCGATKEIMIHWPTPIVIVTASLGARDNASTGGGSIDGPGKAAGSGSPLFEAQARQLIATVKAMADVKHRATPSAPQINRTDPVIRLHEWTGGIANHFVAASHQTSCPDRGRAAHQSWLRRGVGNVVEHGRQTGRASRSRR